MNSPLAVVSESGIPVLFVGGTAVQIYGFSRFTKDFDCLVSHENSAALAAVLQAAEFEEFDRSNVVARYRHVRQTTWLLDTLFVNGETFEKLWADRHEAKLGAVTVFAASPKHIIAMKLHAMTQNANREMFDLLDVLELIKRKRETFSRDELAEICERYGTPALLAKLLAAYDR